MKRIDTISLEIPAGRLEVLAENYRWEADLCLEMARRTDGAVRKDWFLAAAKWIELAEQVDASGRLPNAPRVWEQLSIRHLEVALCLVPYCHQRVRAIGPSFKLRPTRLD